MHLIDKKYLRVLFSLVSIFFLLNFQFEIINNLNSNKEPLKEKLSTDIESNEVILDEINSFCDGVKYQDYGYLKIEDINYIDIEILDRDNWFKNLFYLSFEKQRAINPKYKDEFKAKIKVSYKNKINCESNAEIRISGDWNDHVDKINLLASLDIKLETGNILGITRFKLFLPETRNGDNEIVVTTMLEELGFLSPRSFYVNVGMNNHNNNFLYSKYIFQEKLSKEMIEFNGYREAPLLETNEEFMWNDVVNSSFNSSANSHLFISKPLNNGWSEKGLSQSKITLEGLELFNKAIFNSYNPYSQVNYAYIGKNQDYFYMFDAANIALLAEHGLSTHQRRFYFNKLEDQFYPIYYDGNSNFLELGHIRWKNDYEDLSNLYKGAKSLLENLSFNTESFHQKLNSRGLSYDFNFSYNLYLKFIHNLEIISQKNTDSSPVYKNFYENNSTIIYPEYFKYIFFDDEKEKVEICDFNLNNCIELDKKIENLDLFKNTLEINENKGFLAGKSKESFLDNLVKKESNILNINEIKIEFFGNPYYEIDFNEKILNVVINEKIQKIKISGPGNLDYWNIKVSSNLNTSVSIDRLDKNLLTGCLTIYNLNLNNVNLEVDNLHCEDSVNIINSNGTLNVVEVKNSKSDAVDIDFSKIHINNLIINKAGNDCLDLSGGTYKILEYKADNCNDKGISIGEKTNVNILNTEINTALVGVGIKDSSVANFEKVSVENASLCIASYRKKQEFGPSFIKIKKLDCKNNIPNFIQRGSELKIGN